MNRLRNMLMRTLTVLPFLVAVFLWPGSSLGEEPQNPRNAGAVEGWLAKARQAASADPRAVVEVELVAEYQYFVGSGDRELKDRTALKLPSTLYQERWVNGEHIRRGFADGQAFVETESGRMALGEEFNQEMESYICRRRLEILSFCDHFELDLKKNDSSVELSVRDGEEQFARLQFNAQTALLEVIELPDSELPELAIPEPTDVRLKLSGYQLVDGWNLARHVEMWAEGKKIYQFDITSAKLTRADS